MSVPAVRAALVAVLTASTATVALASATDARPAPAEQTRGGCASPLLARPQPAGAVAERNPSAFRQAAERNHDSATGLVRRPRTTSSGWIAAAWPTTSRSGWSPARPRPRPRRPPPTRACR